MYNGAVERFSGIIFAILFALLLLFPACGERGGSDVGGKLVIKAPEQTRVNETVVIKVTDEKGRPVEKAHFSHGYVGGTGITDKKGEVATFFSQPGTYEYKVTRPGFSEEKGTINIVHGAVELIAFDGIHIGPPPLPDEPAQANNYRPGMLVQFRIKNIGVKEISLPNSAPWQIQTVDGKMMFSPVALQVIASLAPGETKEWNWEQKDNHGNQVKEGTYLVVLCCSEGEYRCLFNIMPEGLQ